MSDVIAYSGVMALREKRIFWKAASVATEIWYWVVFLTTVQTRVGVIETSVAPEAGEVILIGDSASILKFLIEDQGLSFGALTLTLQ